MLNQTNKHIPDILDCIANLSNDEVFTSPKLVNEMLDMLPQELFSSTETKFLDPFCKSGVFLREIVKRLDKCLENKITDKQARIDHIMHKQVFGIAITELTALLSRRTLYCSKYACALENDIWIDENEEDIHETHSYSVSEFTKDDINDFCLNPVFGNIRFIKVNHQYDNNGLCQCCGANISIYKDSDYAYEFIHINEKQLEAFKNMKFDVIIGNPPYQLKDGGGDSSAKPIYNKFVEQAKKLNPKYISMIIPSRWMQAGKGLDQFREVMMNDRRIKNIYDFEDSNICFPGIPLDGGVCYFLWQRDYDGPTNYVFQSYNKDVIEDNRYLTNDLSSVIIRDNRHISILNKVIDKNNTMFSSIVSVRKPFGIGTDLFNSPERYSDANLSDTKFDESYLIFGVKGKKGGAKRQSKYISKSIIPDRIGIDKYKLFFTTSYSTNATVPPETIPASPNEICTETFLMIGPFDTELERDNCNKYIHTDFFRTLLYFRRGSMRVTQSVFEYIPLQDFTSSSKIDWSQSIDDINHQLYGNYSFSEQDIEFINNNIVQNNTKIIKDKNY